MIGRSAAQTIVEADRNLMSASFITKEELRINDDKQKVRIKKEEK